MRTETTFCRICEALCGLEADIEGDRIVQLRPDREHVATAGYGCVKGLKQHELYASPDRLTSPRIRRNGELVDVGWNEAMKRVGDVVRRERAIHPDRIAMYVGTAAGFGVLHPIFAQGFMSGIGSKSMYSSATQDCANKFAAATHLYGFPFTQPFPDLEHTECLIVVGANPAVSKWSFLQVSNPIARLRQMERRGARIFFVDPRRTESAKVAGQHLFIRPGTDVFFYLSFLQDLVARHGVHPNEHLSGIERLLTLVEPWTPERTEAVTHVKASDLRGLVDAYATAESAALYSSTGVNMGGHGALCFWLQEAINALSGNLDRRGGTLVGRGVIDFPAFGKKTGALLRTDRSRVGGFVSTNDTFPGGVLADEILTPGDRQVRVLFVTGGNPLMTMANSGRVAKAFDRLELLVVLDIFPSETAAQADVVLPCTAPTERPDLPFVFPLMLGLQSKPYLQATEALVPAPGNARDEATIYLDLARACGVPVFGSRIVQRALEAAKTVHTLKKRRQDPDAQPSLPQRGLLDLLLRATRQGSFGALLRHEHGRAQQPHAPGTFLGKRVVTDDRRVHLAPEPLMQLAADVLSPSFEREQALSGELKLITRRAVTTHNSWTHNHAAFVRDGTNYLYIHPDDAEPRGLHDGDLADVSSETATVRIPIRRLADLMPGTVALPHGWGHQRAPGLSVASKTRGVNVNLLAADGPSSLERVGGMARLTGIVVKVSRAAGPQAPTWSGLPESN